jgi:hypothetical protein
MLKGTEHKCNCGTRLWCRQVPAGRIRILPPGSRPLRPCENYLEDCVRLVTAPEHGWKLRSKSKSKNGVKRSQFPTPCSYSYSYSLLLLLLATKRRLVLRPGPKQEEAAFKAASRWGSEEAPRQGSGRAPSTGLGAGCWVVPWSSSRRTMKRRKRRAPNCIVRGAVPKYARAREFSA